MEPCRAAALAPFPGSVPLRPSAPRKTGRIWLVFAEGYAARMEHRPRFLVGLSAADASKKFGAETAQWESASVSTSGNSVRKKCANGSPWLDYTERPSRFPSKLPRSRDHIPTRYRTMICAIGSSLKQRASAFQSI
jgi:hypothetical protein